MHVVSVPILLGALRMSTARPLFPPATPSDLDCTVQTFREQVPGVLERYQRRISRLTAPLRLYRSVFEMCAGVRR
jgi:hypothetical protein